MASPRRAWALDGSFMAFRQLQQRVPEFSKFLANQIIPFGPGWTQQRILDTVGARILAAGRAEDR